MANCKHGGDLLAAAVRAAYADGENDYSMAPLARLGADGAPLGKIRAGDAVAFCCRRGEREIELTDAFTDEAFSGFDRPRIPELDFAILTMYHDKYAGKLPIAFAPARVEKPLAQLVSEAGMRQLHTAESEKFAHVTFFFNGGANEPFPGEDDVRFQSPKGVPFDSVPELSLPQVADRVIEGLGEGYEFIVTNFANGDVIGHTANCDAKVDAAGHVSRHLERVVEAAKRAGYVIAVTADHGNLEVMLTPEGKPHVAHTTNLVPLVLIDPQNDRALPVRDGRLADVAPTLLQVLGLRQPPEMTGASLAPDVDFGAGRKVLLIICDGWGFGAADKTDPVFLGDTPYWDALCAAYPPAKLRASGEDVGLQDGKTGNSEAGHINLGSGRVVMQDDVRLDRAMKDGSFQQNEVYLRMIEDCRKRGGALHLLALLTKKSSHGSIDYPLALARMAKDLPEVYVHVIFDGRSTEPGSAPALLEEFDALLEETGCASAQIVDGIGRGIALDRDLNWVKVQKAYDMLVSGVGRTY